MAVSKNNLLFYLTSDDPFGSVSDTSQSIGGYPTTVYGPTGALSSDVTINTTTISSLAEGNSLVGSEIIYANVSHVVTRPILGTSAESNTSTTPVTFLNRSLFNNAFDNGQQYRCIAIKNTHTTDSFLNLSLYIKYNSLTSNTQIALAIETPTNDVVNGTVDSGTIITIVDDTLSSYDDNYFTNAVITILSGDNINQQRIIVSFDNATRTLVLDSALPFAAASGNTYRISSGPAQRTSAGTQAPSGLTFFSAIDIDHALDINIGNNRTNGSSLLPNEIVYLWLRRTRSTNAVETLNNRIIISAHYGTV